MRPHSILVTSFLVFLLSHQFALAQQQAETRFFQIRAIDAETGRGIPLVFLKTVNNIQHVSDSAGYVAFHEPGLMNQRVFFFVSSDGYEFPKDGFGFAGTTLNVVEGGKAVIQLKRKNIAERLYRVTGAGIYRDSILLNQKPPIEKRVINANVLGSDSVISTIYNDKIYWFWGDTNRPGYPLGNFHVPGAISDLPGDQTLPIHDGINLTYFVDKQKKFAKETAKMPGPGPTWVFGLTTLRQDGVEQMLATYNKVKPPLEIYERGVIRFDKAREQFKKLKAFPEGTQLFASGHPVKQIDDGVEYLYFPHPYPLTRVRASVKDYQNPNSYQTYTCLKEGSTKDDLEIELNENGAPKFEWKPNTIPWSGKLQTKLINVGKLDVKDAILKTIDIETGNDISLHGSSVYFNEFRNRWIMIALEQFGTSPLGEIWYLESKSLHGPWARARKIVSHEKYSFYNPKQHPMFAHDNYIYFEGTYTTMFSKESTPTPRYNYNQVMYRLDLNDARLKDAQSN